MYYEFLSNLNEKGKISDKMLGYKEATFFFLMFLSLQLKDKNWFNKVKSSLFFFFFSPWPQLKTVIALLIHFQETNKKKRTAQQAGCYDSKDKKLAITNFHYNTDKFNHLYVLVVGNIEIRIEFLYHEKEKTN